MEASRQERLSDRRGCMLGLLLMSTKLVTSFFFMIGLLRSGPPTKNAIFASNIMEQREYSGKSDKIGKYIKKPKSTQQQKKKKQINETE